MSINFTKVSRKFRRSFCTIQFSCKSHVSLLLSLFFYLNISYKIDIIQFTLFIPCHIKNVENKQKIYFDYLHVNSRTYKNVNIAFPFHLLFCILFCVCKENAKDIYKVPISLNLLILAKYYVTNRIFIFSSSSTLSHFAFVDAVKQKMTFQ